MFKHLNTRIPKRIEQEKDKVSAVMIPLIKKNDGYHIPVSYTHLDVYKRQTYILGLFAYLGVLPPPLEIFSEIGRAHV